MTDDARIEVIIIELIRDKLIDATDSFGRRVPDEHAVRQALLYAKSRPSAYAKLMKAAIRITTALDRLEAAEKRQKVLDLEADPQTQIEHIWEAVQEFGKQ
jgi:hypothetical protein